MSLEKLRKISEDMILYAVRASDYEPLGFDNDALAGVRADYFNAKCMPQENKTDFSVQGVPHSLSYSMKNGSSLAWKITVGNRTAETVRRLSDGSYCVMTYGENDVVFKRQYFDSTHLWLRTEYYDRVLDNRIVANLYPHLANGVMVLCLQEFSNGGMRTRELYPSLEEPAEGCAAMAYADSGMLWYDERFRLGESVAEEPEEPEASDGFHFIKEAFTGADPEDVLGLQNAAYLGESDAVPTAEEPPVPVADPEDQSYSAYDTIEKILFEAQKTNKNIFGVLQDFGDDEPDAADAGGSTETTGSETPVTSEKTQEPAAQKTEQAAAGTEPDLQIKTKDGTYSYFGELDTSKHRSGRGRTVTPDGVTSYDGTYRDDKREGFGVCYYKEGSPNYIGDWTGGKRNGRGVGYRRSDGTMHAGKWKNNKPEGIGARFDADGNFVDICTYVDGKRSGKSVSFDARGNPVVTLWRNGEAVSKKTISD